MTTPPPHSEPPTTQPIAGWYPDPNVGQLRYWDGQRWTEHLTPYPDGDPGAPPPPSAGDAIVGVATGIDSPNAADRLPPLSQWMSETFKLVIDQAGHLFALLVVLTFAVDLAAAGLSWLAFRDLVLTFDDETISAAGANSWMVGAVIATLLSFAAKIVLGVCSARHVLAARTGVPESWSDTLRAAASRAPRLLGALLAFAGALLVLFLIILIPLGILTAVPVVGLFALVAAIGGLLAGLGRIGFGPVMALTAPVGDGGIRRSISLTRGATVLLLKRLSMLAMIGFTMYIIASLFTAPLLGGDGEIVLADGILDVGDVVGDNAAAFGIVQIIGGLVAGAFAALAGGGLGLLYADLGGPIEPTITDVDATGVSDAQAS